MRDEPKSDPDASPDFDQLFRDEYKNMVMLAVAICGSSVWAEDIVQEAFSRLNTSWNRTGKYDKPGAWLRRVTINLAISKKRSLVSEAAYILKLKRSATNQQATRPSMVQADQPVWDAVRKLPAKQRAAVALRYLEDRPIDEIAELLEISASTARTHLQRAHEKLNQSLKES